MTRKVYYIAFFLMLASQAAFSQIVKWTDEDGRVHYGDRIPEKYRENSEEVHLNTSNFIDNDHFKYTSRSPKRETKKYDEVKPSIQTPDPRVQEQKCIKDYGLSCDRVNNWEKYALAECVKQRNGRRCKDGAFLSSKYRPVTIEQKRANGRIARENRKMREAARMQSRY